MAFEKSKWIWLASGECDDQYAEFIFDISGKAGDEEMLISCDSNYALFINESYVASGQYGDFEHYKIYDTIPISDRLTVGKNSIRILVHHTGTPTSRYRPAAAGLIFEIRSGDRLLIASSEEIRSRVSPNYESGRCSFISTQLGYSFAYDATADEGEYKSSREVMKLCGFFPRPIKKSSVLPKLPMNSIKQISETRYLIDLGKEAVGLPSLSFYTERQQTLTVAFGEHIEDGGVRYRIGNRNFSFEYRAHAGENSFTEYMLRVGCRYFEVFSEQPLKIEYVGLLPEVYPAVPRKAKIADPLRERIYDISQNTLKLCMMEHYVDCPWREQALYSFDSRNQMLCGYYAFEGKNSEYARANLKLIGMDTRDDKLLSICYPAGIDLAIPSFSLYYFISMKEYIEHTGDVSLAIEVYPKLCEILNVFLNNTKDGLITKFGGLDHWNFYDWSEYSSGRLSKEEEPIPDLAINCLFILALEAMEYICERAALEFPFSGIADGMRHLINEHFLTGSGLYTMHIGRDEICSLGNSLAILAGAANEGNKPTIAEAIVSGSIPEPSLSMKVLEYEALLSVDEKYRGYILSDIDKKYSRIIDYGSDTVWETIDGPSAFSGAGSLCHGWSAVPIYIYNKLGIVNID